MPYSGPDDNSLPTNVASLPAASRRQWVAVWNATYANCRSPKVGGQGSTAVCEATAAKFANGVIKRAAAKEGRVLSGANLAAMVAAMQQIIDVMKRAGYDMQEMMAAKAFSLDSQGGTTRLSLPEHSQSSLPEPAYSLSPRRILAAVFSSYKARVA